MKFLKYVKDNILNILIYFSTLILICLMLGAFKIKIYINITIFIILLFNGIVIILLSYFRKYRFYNSFVNNLEKLDKKYLILETIPEPNTYEEKIMELMKKSLKKFFI